MVERLLDIIRKDIGRKVTAILFAIIIWYAVRQQIQKEDYYSNVEVQLVAENSSVYIGSDKVILKKVMIKGSPKEIDLITDKSLIIVQVEIPEPSDDQTEYTFKIRDSHFTLPGTTLKVFDIDPKEFTIPIDKVESKDVSVRPIFDSSQLKGGWNLFSTVADPPNITISGPSRVIKDIDIIETKELIITDEKIDKMSVELDHPKSIKVDGTQAVDVKLIFTKGLGSKIFNDVPIHVLNLNNSEFYVESMSVDRITRLTIEGPRDRLNEISLGSIRAFIELNPGLGAGTYRSPIKVYIDANGFKSSGFIEPSEVQITIKKR